MAGALGLQAESLEPSMDGELGNAGLGGQGADAPMGGSGWWLQWRMRTTATRWPSWVGPGRSSSCSPALVVQAMAPFAHRHLAHPQSLGNLQVGLPSSQARMLGPPHQARGQPQGAGHGLQFLSPSPDQWNWGATNAHGPTPPMDGGWAPLGLREAPGRAISRSQEDGPQAWSQRGKAYPLVPTPAVPLARGTVPDLGGCPWGTPLCLGSWRSPKGRPTGAGGGPKTDTLRALRCAVLALQDACSLS